MDSISDDRIQFYLEHKFQIEEWAAIADDVPAVAHRFMRSLKEGIHTLARAHDVNPWTPDGANLYGHFLVRQRWLTGQMPDVAIGVCWEPDHVNFSSQAPQVGVWINQRSPDTQRISAALNQELAFTQWSHHMGNVPMVVQKRVRPEGTFWEDLAPYRASLRRAVDSAWRDLAEHVDKSVS